MPHQRKAFNGDGFLAAKVLDFRDRFKIDAVVETGTCLGSSTLWFADHFRYVSTMETHEPFHNVAKARPRNPLSSVDFILGSSHMWLLPAMRQATNMDSSKTILVFLDAHWEKFCPLMEELAAIRESGQKPVIMIHDFKVPGHPELGFDCMPDGRPFELEMIAEALDQIYGVEGWLYEYNQVAAGARRGCVFIYAK
jgi:hypothetical protein